jgi:hypothetical protein
MGISGGPDMIQDGLILALNAADRNSYPGSGTTWNDLSGNNNTGTLTNSPTYNNLGYFTFSSNKHVTTSLSNIALSSATFISWVYSTQTQASYTGIIYSRSGTEPAGISLYSNNSIGYTWTNTPATYNWDSGLLVPNNAWSMVAVSINSTTATAYLCQSSGITTSTNNKEIYKVIKSGTCFQLNSQETVSANYVFVRVKNGDYNYSNNPSFLSGSSGQLIYPSLVNSPQTFPTTVGLYNNNGDLLAVAKMSKPLLKDFTHEALIRVKLDW